MRKIKRIKMTIAVCAAALAALACACGKKEESTPEGAETVLSSEMTEPAPPSTRSGGQEASQESPASSDPAGEAPEEDPWAEGYYYDAALSEALWERFATENTNNTDRDDPACAMSGDFLEELNRRAGRWLWEGVSDGDTEHAMLALSFRFPDDPPDFSRGMRSVKAGVYALKGREPDGLAARIRLGNTEACFYLFLRVYYSAAEDRTRVYMVNGLVW